jgi:streptogrisin B
MVGSLSLSEEGELRLKRTIPLMAGASVLVAAAFLAPASAQAAPAQAHKAADARAAVASADIPGTAWGTDAHGRTLVTVDKTVSGAELGKLRQATRAYGDSVHIRRTAGTFRTLLSAGDAIYGGQYRCSLGFNVQSGSGAYYFLTAGHCGKAASPWYTDAAHNTLIGPVTGAAFPGSDYAIVRYDNTSLSHPGGFTAGDAYVGEKVTRDGSTTGVHSGTVQALNVTVHYSGGGTVRGLIQTNVCAEPGDSGGPLYDGSTGLGLTSGGSGDCRTGGTTFFQPVKPALSAYGVNLY